MNKSTIEKTNEFNNVAEISISYKPKIPVNQKPQIMCSNDIYKIMRKVFADEVINHHEEFWILLLNRTCRVLGTAKVAQGGIQECPVDIRIIFQYALKANAINIALCHNHPSNELKPSWQDKILTQRILEIGRFLNVEVIDHLIVTENSYLSFADEGMLN